MSPAPAPATLTFLGAAGTVTGSKFLVEAGGRRLLLDCGLFQGPKGLRARNWTAPSFSPDSLDAVVLSHAHLDHAGALPLLARQGFRGPIHCTAGTADLLEVMLLDSARIQEEDAARANRYGYTRHAPALPLYTVDDARRALDLVVPHPYGAGFTPCRDVEASLRRAGHVLGSAIVELGLPAAGGVRVVYSGDLGRWGRPILRDPELCDAADVLLVESTYGDRLHAPDPERVLATAITETARRGGVIIVPAFALGRTQELMWTLRKLDQAGLIPPLPIYIDSPMGAAVTDLYCRHPEDHDLDLAALQDEARCVLRGPRQHVIRTVDESRRLNDRSGPMVIVAGSGMLTGGRVLHHLAQRLPDPRNTVLLVGYQAPGTRGRALAEGATELKVHGALVPVQAQIVTIDGLSAHADQADLLRWLGGFRVAPASTYVVHGEAKPAEALAGVVRARLAWQVEVARDGMIVPLGSGI